MESWYINGYYFLISGDKIIDKKSQTTEHLERNPNSPVVQAAIAKVLKKNSNEEKIKMLESPPLSTSSSEETKLTVMADIEKTQSEDMASESNQKLIQCAEEGHFKAEV